MTMIPLRSENYLIFLSSGPYTCLNMNGTVSTIYSSNSTKNISVADPDPDPDPDPDY